MISFFKGRIRCEVHKLFALMVPYRRANRVISEKKGPDCVHTSQNVFLRVCKRKNFKFFPCGALFPGSFHEMFIKVP